MYACPRQRIQKVKRVNKHFCIFLKKLQAKTEICRRVSNTSLLRKLKNLLIKLDMRRNLRDIKKSAVFLVARYPPYFRIQCIPE